MLGLAGLRRALGKRRPLGEISQRAFDHDDGHLRRLVRLDADAKPDPIDLVDYALDIHYEEVQKDLLLWVLPFCLRAWRDDLRGEDASYGGFVEGLYPALVDGRILDPILDEPQRAAVALFMRETILEEIDDQAGLSFSGMNARPYRWVYALTTYGVLHPDSGTALERLVRPGNARTCRCNGSVHLMSGLPEGRESSLHSLDPQWRRRPSRPLGVRWTSQRPSLAGIQCALSRRRAGADPRHRSPSRRRCPVGERTRGKRSGSGPGWNCRSHRDLGATLPRAASHFGRAPAARRPAGVVAVRSNLTTHGAKEPLTRLRLLPRRLLGVSATLP
jgi:hypothetical protein